MKELDLLLERYLEERLSTATVAHQRAFCELLEAQDPLIHAWCLGGLPAPLPLRSLIEEITRASGAGGSAPGDRA